MVMFTTTQWVILFLVLVLGWILGLMSRSGGARWKRELADERRANETYRRDHDARLEAANARIAELERDRVVVRDPVDRRDSTIDNLDLRRP